MSTPSPDEPGEFALFLRENWFNFVVAVFAGVFASWILTASVLVVSPRYIDIAEVATSQQEIGWGTFGAAILFILWKWRERFKPVPLLSDWMPADAAAQLAASKAEKDTLAEKWDDGEITGKEYTTALDAINERANAVKMAWLAALLGNWITQARDHWRQFRPSLYRQAKKAGTLDALLLEAAQLTKWEMDSLMERGLSEQGAWEMVREQYLFPPEKPPLMVPDVETVEGQTIYKLLQMRREARARASGE